MSQLKQLLEFMYSGQVIVEQQQLESLLQAAQVLGIRGLTDVVSLFSNNTHQHFLTDVKEWSGIYIAMHDNCMKYQHWLDF